MRDASDTGARLEFEDGWFVPDRFVLFVEVDGYKVECERIWQKGKNCGVHFVGPKLASATHRPQALKEYHPPAQLADRSVAAVVLAPPVLPGHHAPKSPGFGRRLPGKS